MKRLRFLLLIIFGSLLVYGSLELPDRGDADAHANRRYRATGYVKAASYHIQHAYKDAATPNMVTVILADYRGFDTLGEEVVILTAGIICFLLLRKRKIKHEQD